MLSSTSYRGVKIFMLAFIHLFTWIILLNHQMFLLLVWEEAWKHKTKKVTLDYKSWIYSGQGHNRRQTYQLSEASLRIRLFIVIIIPNFYMNWVRDNAMPSSTGDTPSIAYRPAVILPIKKKCTISTAYNVAQLLINRYNLQINYALSRFFFLIKDVLIHFK
jgi:hypothetical protein